MGPFKATPISPEVRTSRTQSIISLDTPMGAGLHGFVLRNDGLFQVAEPNLLVCRRWKVTLWGNGKEHTRKRKPSTAPCTRQSWPYPYSLMPVRWRQLGPTMFHPVRVTCQRSPESSNRCTVVRSLQCLEGKNQSKIMTSATPRESCATTNKSVAQIVTEIMSVLIPALVAYYL